MSEPSVRVFLVDDTPELRRRVRRHLSESGGVAVIGEADDPVTGLPRIAELQPDVVLLDLSMPNMDGLEAIEHVAASAPDAGIVVYSGFLSEAMAPTALSLGADRYVEKNQSLREVLETVLEVARDRREGRRPVAPERPPAPPVVAAGPPQQRTRRRPFGVAVGIGAAIAAVVVLALADGVAAGALGGALACLAVCAFAAAVAAGKVRARLAAAADLERSNAELEQFAYIASHDLSEPLRTVTGFAKVLERQYGAQLDERGQRSIGAIVAGVDRMQSMIRDLLEYSRAGSAELQLEPVDLGTLAGEVRAALESAVSETGAQITVGELPTVEGDPNRLGQVMQNLLGNAIKFARPGEAPRVHIDADRVDGAWCVRVRDQGIGIDPRNADRIFRMFQRLHGVEQYSGTGIGLAICQRIVERHGGRIWVESQPGEGATFSFTLPA